MGKRKKQSGQGALNNRLKLVVRSGKYAAGWNETLRALRTNRSKLVLLSNNLPGLKRSEIEYYCMLGRIPIIHYDGNNNDLGRACGKLYATSVMTVIEAGDSDILKAIEEKQKRKRAKKIGLQSGAAGVPQ
mmetsp:Transcript_13802/g.21630  ORF Transcript_13802/g.21630 Transcript_13802/m.21630 type:complete len:131 (-) Transcript_13802:109-501(-)